MVWCAAGPTAACYEVRIDPPSVPVGGLALLRVNVADVVGTFDGKLLRFFPAGRQSLALIGIDLDERPGHHPIELSSRSSGRRSADLEVVERRFPEERLTVPKSYTEPDPPTVRRIAREQRRLEALWGKSAAARLWGGPFTAPTDGPPGSPFGLRRFFNGEPRSPHAGIDFRAPQGSPVRAANRGRVVLADELFFTGNTIVLDHGLGLFTLYVHLSRIAVERGRVVDKGEEIGQVGMTGRATGPHLHFATRVGAARIDPQALLGRALD